MIRTHNSAEDPIVLSSDDEDSQVTGGRAKRKADLDGSNQTSPSHGRLKRPKLKDVGMSISAPPGLFGKGKSRAKSPGSRISSTSKNGTSTSPRRGLSQGTLSSFGIRLGHGRQPNGESHTPSSSSDDFPEASQVYSSMASGQSSGFAHGTQLKKQDAPYWSWNKGSKAEPRPKTESKLSPTLGRRNVQKIIELDSSSPENPRSNQWPFSKKADAKPYSASSRDNGPPSSIRLGNSSRRSSNGDTFRPKAKSAVSHEVIEISDDELLIIDPQPLPFAQVPIPSPKHSNTDKAPSGARDLPATPIAGPSRVNALAGKSPVSPPGKATRSGLEEMSEDSDPLLLLSSPSKRSPPGSTASTYENQSFAIPTTLPPLAAQGPSQLHQNPQSPPKVQTRWPKVHLSPMSRSQPISPAATTKRTKHGSPIRPRKASSGTILPSGGSPSRIASDMQPVVEQIREPLEGLSLRMELPLPTSSPARRPFLGPSGSQNDISNPLVATPSTSTAEPPSPQPRSGSTDPALISSTKDGGPRPGTEIAIPSTSVFTSGVANTELQPKPVKNPSAPNKTDAINNSSSKPDSFGTKRDRVLSGVLEMPAPRKALSPPKIISGRDQRTSGTSPSLFPPSTSPFSRDMSISEVEHQLGSSSSPPAPPSSSSPAPAELAVAPIDVDDAEMSYGVSQASIQASSSSPSRNTSPGSPVIRGDPKSSAGRMLRKKVGKSRTNRERAHPNTSLVDTDSSSSEEPESPPKEPAFFELPDAEVGMEVPSESTSLGDNSSNSDESPVDAPTRPRSQKARKSTGIVPLRLHNRARATEVHTSPSEDEGRVTKTQNKLSYRESRFESDADDEQLDSEGLSSVAEVEPIQENHGGGRPRRMAAKIKNYFEAFPILDDPPALPTDVESVPDSIADSPPSSSGEVSPIFRRSYGGFPVSSWSNYQKDLSNFSIKTFFSKDLPTGLMEEVNSWSEFTKQQKDVRALFEAAIAEHTADDEPHAPPINILNTIDADATPPWEFYYTNRMWLGEGVSVSKVEQLTGCGCVGKCNPKSKTCSCVKKQRTYLPLGEEGFLYNEQSRVKAFHEPIYECNMLCGCGPECQNRVVQNGRTVYVDIKKTVDKGWGVFAGPKKISKGTFIGVYAGELLTTDVAEKRGEYYDTFGRTYLFDIDFGHLQTGDTDAAEDSWEAKYTVDAFHAGNFTRYLNHSCDPNCKIMPVYINEPDEDKPLLAIFASKDIKPEEEICFSYVGDQNETEEEVKAARAEVEEELRNMSGNEKAAVFQTLCKCGAANCKKKQLW